MQRDLLPVFVGLDLAWSERNFSGGAVIYQGRLTAWTGALGDNASILDFVAGHLPENATAVIGVDAPLRVPNQTGRRRCDHEVSLAWGRYGAGAYPANRSLLAHNGVVRGEALVALLARELGFVECPSIVRQLPGRYVCEVFPHPSLVALFHLPRALRYKRKPGRSKSLVEVELASYQMLLCSLVDFDPPLVGIEEARVEDIASLRGRAWKSHEDTLDAIACAYVAYYLWQHGPEAAVVYGSLEEGHIVIPAPIRHNSFIS